jgi:hypothetical protein
MVLDHQASNDGNVICLSVPLTGCQRELCLGCNSWATYHLRISIPHIFWCRFYNSNEVLICKGKDKVVPVPFLTAHHPIKAIGGVEV